jgi:hypothetical protein
MNYQDKLAHLEKDTSESLKRTLVDANKTYNIGVEIMTELDSQKSQILNMEKNIEMLDNNNTRATRLLNSIRNIFGSITNKIIYSNNEINCSNNDSHLHNETDIPKVVASPQKNQIYNCKTNTKMI